MRPIILSCTLFVAFATAGEAAADDTVSFEISANVGHLCLVEGEVFPTAGSVAAPQPIAAGETSASTLDLENAQDQAVGTFSLQCNSPNTTVSIASQNGFVLRGGSGSGNGTDISYALKVEGIPALSAGVRENSAFSEATGPGLGVTRRLLVNVGILDLFDYAPGVYSDQLLVTVEPGL